MEASLDVVTVWRVESEKSRKGPYRACNYDILDNMVSTNQHPTPISDVGLSDWWFHLPEDEEKSWYCGFSSAQQYRRWFRDLKPFYNYNERREKLFNEYDDQYGLAKYMVAKEHASFGDRQMMFIREQATRVSFRVYKRPLISTLAQKLAA